MTIHLHPTACTSPEKIGAIEAATGMTALPAKVGAVLVPTESLLPPGLTMADVDAMTDDSKTITREQ